MTKTRPMTMPPKSTVAPEIGAARSSRPEVFNGGEGHGAHFPMAPVASASACRRVTTNSQNLAALSALARGGLFVLSCSSQMWFKFLWMPLCFPLGYHRLRELCKGTVLELELLVELVEVPERFIHSLILNTCGMPHKILPASHRRLAAR